jgi:diguanylate cyclase (GGDEF)-like protein
VVPLGPRPVETRPRLPEAALRLLVVDHDDAGFERVGALLAEVDDADFVLERAHTTEAALVRLAAGGIDLCLVALALPGRDGLELVRESASRDLGVPMVLLCEGADRATDLAASAQGAADFLATDELDPRRLERSVRFAVARARDASRLARLAQYDELTGLANRVLFQDRLARAFAAARRQERQVAVMILDLDGFKPVNDRLGHAAGDALLRITGERLRARLRESDTVARLGGDEFGIVVESLAKPEHAALVARKLLDAVAPPVCLEGREVLVGASLGVALYPRDGDSPDAVKRCADAAMYRAKAEGGHVARFHDPGTESRLRRGALIETDLRRGLERGELVLHFQPQITLRPGPLGLAALLRWQHPDFGLVGADRFLGLAEDVGLLDALAAFALDAACAQAQRWQEGGLAPLRLALPILSRRQLGWSDLARRVGDRLSAHGLAADRLELEIDEALWLAEVERGGAALAALGEMGVRLALAGFGDGPAALRTLEGVGLDTLKLSRRLVQDVPDDARRSALVRAVIGLAHDLGLRVVAEGADRPAQLGFLRRLGCDAVQSIQGAPALPAEGCTAWLREARLRA